MENSNEVEVKIPLSGHVGIQARLEETGFRISVPREWEANDLFDTPDGTLRQKTMLLRLRQSGHRSILTWKGPGEPGPHKSRPELETSVGSLDTLRRIFEQLGYRQNFRYEKYRTEYKHPDGGGVVTIDETPIGDFLEIEGPAPWIDTTAALLGFSPQNYVLESYGSLYLNYCKQRGLEPGNMVFASNPAGTAAQA